MWLALLGAALLAVLVCWWFWRRARACVCALTPRRPLLRAPGALLHPLPVYWLESVISEQENAHLLRLGKAKLQRSKVEGEHTSPDRTSSSAYLDDDAVIRAIKQRLAALCNYPERAFEPLQLVHYAPQQQYRPHYDYLERPDSAHRHVTFFIYLDDADGATEFPQLGLRVQPKRNCAALWYNVDAQGRPDPRTLHAGLPPTREKHGINVWVRG